jgi:purine-binding chemotaxis protein CheW
MTELLLIVTLAGQRVAIPATAVESVVEIESLTPVPGAGVHVAGLAALRSRVLTVIDCLASLELGVCVPEGTHEAIVVEVDGHHYALLVEAVEDVLEFSGEIRPVRTTLSPGWRRVAKGMVEVGGDLLLLVCSDSLLAGPAVQAA